MRFTNREKTAVVAIYAALAGVTIAGFAASYAVGQSYIVFGSLAVTAYVLGLRHGVDADHIAAIDNATRKLLQEGKRPLTVGTWFSLGHSTVVVVLVLALVVGTNAVLGTIPAIRSLGAIAGTAVSGGFLLVIGLINLAIVIEILGTFRRLKEGNLDEDQLEKSLANRGFMSRRFGKLFGIIRSPWQAYPVGFLFGLGFDTASEVALIAVSIGIGTTSGIPLWMILVMPLMFAAGMVLVDTTDGISMWLAYGWALLNPIRKVYYNLTVTVISVLVAFFIGGLEVLGVVLNELGMTGGYWASVENLDFQTLGIGVLVTFGLSWLVSLGYYRYKGYERVLARPPGGSKDQALAP